MAEEHSEKIPICLNRSNAVSKKTHNLKYVDEDTASQPKGDTEYNGWPFNDGVQTDTVIKTTACIVVFCGSLLVAALITYIVFVRKHLTFSSSSQFDKESPLTIYCYGLIVCVAACVVFSAWILIGALKVKLRGPEPKIQCINSLPKVEFKECDSGYESCKNGGGPAQTRTGRVSLRTESRKGDVSELSRTGQSNGSGCESTRVSKVHTYGCGQGTKRHVAVTGRGRTGIAGLEMKEMRSEGETTEDSARVSKELLAVPERSSRKKRMVLRQNSRTKDSKSEKFKTTVHEVKNVSARYKPEPTTRSEQGAIRCPLKSEEEGTEVILEYGKTVQAVTALDRSKKAIIRNKMMAENALKKLKTVSAAVNVRATSRQCQNEGRKLIKTSDDGVAETSQ